MTMYHHQQFYPQPAQMSQSQQQQHVPMHQQPLSSSVLPTQQQHQPPQQQQPPTSMAPQHHHAMPPPGHFAPPQLPAQLAAQQHAVQYTQFQQHHQYVQMMQFQPQPLYVTPPPMDAAAGAPVGAVTAGAPPATLNPNMHHHNVGYPNYHPQMFPTGGPQGMQPPYFFAAPQQMFSTPPPHLVAQEQHNNQMLTDVHIQATNFKPEYSRKLVADNNLPDVNTLSIADSSGSVGGSSGAVHESPRFEETVVGEPTAHLSKTGQAMSAEATESVASPKAPAVTETTANIAAPAASDSTPPLQSLRDVVTGRTQSPAKPANRLKTPPSARPHDDNRSVDWRSQRPHENARKGGGKFTICYYCQYSGKPESEYKSHSTMQMNNVVCPLLREVGCKECGKNGNEAHPEINCPKRKQEHDNFEQFAHDVSARVGGGVSSGGRYGGGSGGGGGGSGGGYGHYSGGGGGPPRNTGGGHRGGSSGPRNARRS